MLDDEGGDSVYPNNLHEVRQSSGVSHGGARAGVDTCELDCKITRKRFTIFPSGFRTIQCKKYTFFDSACIQKRESGK